MLLGRLPLSIATGFIIFCIGGAARAYMDFSVNGWQAAYNFKRGNTESTYRQLVKKRRARAWPFFVSVTCIPLGFLIVFGSIIWVNLHRH
jgi:hypothetical protein